MENVMLRPCLNASINFNNMTDEQLQEWRTAFLTEAQRENYVNHNLEIVRHYRTEAISRAPALDLERSAISAAIARHGLCASNAAGESAVCSLQAAVQDEVQPPPMRRPRMEHPQPPEQQNVAAAPSCSGSGSGTAATGNYGHYVALAHIFSDTYATRAERTASAAVANASGNISSSNISNGSNNNEPEASEINDLAITKTIDTLGLRRI